MLRCSELEIALKASYARELECRTNVFFKQIPPNRSVSYTYLGNIY